jgi:hypothetical protein
MRSSLELAPRRPRSRPRARAAAAASPLLELQATAGNAAVARLVQREATAAPRPRIALMAGERVEVANEAEQHEAEQILVEIRNRYGIRLSSPMGLAGLHRYYKREGVSQKELGKTGYAVWNMQEIRALKEGLKHFAPILGKQRERSGRKGKWQEVTSLSKLTVAITQTGLPDPTVEGEAFGEVKNVTFFDADTKGANKGDYKTREEELVGTVIHELTHDLMAYALDDWIDNLPWWTAAGTRSDAEGVEAPINDYAATAPGEDLSESFAYYFLEPDVLRGGTGKKLGTPGNPCRKRFALVDRYVKSWQPKR